MDRQVLADAIRALPTGALVSLSRESLLEVLEGQSNGEAAAADRPVSTHLVDLTVNEVARLFGRAPSTIRQWLESHRLKGYKLLGREWRIPTGAVTAFQERQRLTQHSVDNPTLSSHRGGSLGDWRRIAGAARPDQRRDERHD